MNQQTGPCTSEGCENSLIQLRLCLMYRLSDWHTSMNFFFSFHGGSMLASTYTGILKGVFWKQ